MADATPPKSSAASTHAKGILAVGLVALGIFGPLIGLKTEQNMANELILLFRPWHALAAIFAAIAVYVILGGVKAARTAHADRPMAPAVAVPRNPLLRYVPSAGFAFLFAYPLLVILLTGVTGVPKWVDNFGILILIYVMLGWGLNIVVGLAGLLDLGYVAFYAIGSYSYALLSLHFGWSFWLCLPVAGILAAFWGVILGFPVLRLRGDYLAIVTLAFGEIIYLVAKNWRNFTGGGAGISAPRISFFGIKFDGTPTGFAA